MFLSVIRLSACLFLGHRKALALNLWWPLRKPSACLKTLPYIVLSTWNIFPLLGEFLKQAPRVKEERQLVKEHPDIGSLTECIGHSTNLQGAHHAVWEMDLAETVEALLSSDEGKPRAGRLAQGDP